MPYKNKLSVIIPVYNGEQYLSRCLDSILNQSLKEIEIIIVDDASTDQTLMVSKEYASKYNIISIIELAENSGTGKARNIGLSKTNSEFVSFLDADDWMDLNAYLTMYNELIKTDSDIAVCGIRTEFNNYLLSDYRYTYPYQNIISGAFALKLLCKTEMQDSFISPMVGNKMFRTEFLKNTNIFFPELKYFEDDEFMFKAFYYAEKIVLIPNVYQHYYQRATSAMHAFSKEYIDCFIQIFENLKNQFSNVISEDYLNEYHALMRRCFSTLLKLLFTYEQSSKVQNAYIQYLLEKLISKFSLEELILCIDFERIYHCI